MVDLSQGSCAILIMIHTCDPLMDCKYCCSLLFEILHVDKLLIKLKDDLYELYSCQNLTKYTHAI